MKKSDRPRAPRALPLAEILEGLLRERGMDTKLHKYRAFSCWPKAVGPQIAAQTQPARIRDGVLEVKVAHPVWMQQLQLLKPRILARLAEELGPDVIREIYLRQGRIERGGHSEPAAPPAWRDVALSPEEEDEIHRVAERLADPDLRDEFERLMRRQKKLNKCRERAQSPEKSSS
ncbi:MAG TPA: DUF721 domain-containing protein [Geoalkalibacter subterraneus]|uniref:DUF721 domain-containing protein n=1 Tax=Geoalkalibacter subterraneus TaxID=483547 RepID=A0A831PNH4_9BACT|nr:DUF721 domain-containing protein [Geoalkalibacter subterraneus]